MVVSLIHIQYMRLIVINCNYSSFVREMGVICTKQVFVVHYWSESALCGVTLGNSMTQVLFQSNVFILQSHKPSFYVGL
jgi:hypothetical protein